MAQPPLETTSPSVEDSFTADRVLFWQRFTGFTKGAIIALVLLLLGMLVFLA